MTFLFPYNCHKLKISTYDIVEPVTEYNEIYNWFYNIYYPTVYYTYNYMLLYSQLLLGTFTTDANEIKAK